MKTIKYLSILITIIILAVYFLFNSLTVYIPAGFVGVRTQEYAVFGTKGVVKKDYGPGWHRDFGPIDSWQIYDSTVQSLEMTRDPYRGSEKGRDDIRVQSLDGYAVSVDVTVKYRISDQKAHKVYENTGGGVKYKRIVRNEVQDVCMELFGGMNTEDFYDPVIRMEQSEKAQKLLSKKLKNNFIDVIDVLIRNVQFDPKYENKIRSKKLADQEVELNKSLGKAAEMRGKTQKIEAETKKLLSIIRQEKKAELIKMKAETERQVTGIKAEAEKYVTEKQADADLIASKNEAKGDLLIKEAKAEGEKLRNEAMQGVGGSTIVALEAAKNLNLEDIIISTIQLDILDIDKMATKLGVVDKKYAPKVQSLPEKKVEKVSKPIKKEEVKKEK